MPNSIDTSGTGITITTGATTIYTHPGKPASNTYVKGMSLAQIGDLLWASFKEQFDDYYNMWVHDIYDEDGYIIVNWHKKLFKVNYTRDDNGATFDDIQSWTVVVRKTEYVPADTEQVTNAESPMGEMDDMMKSAGLVKSFDADTIGGYAVIWGNEKKKDLSGEWFSKDETQELLNVQKTVGAIPWFLEHTDDVLKSTVIAAIDEMGEDEIGVWYKAKIKQHELYKKFVEPLIVAKALYSSSSTFPLAKEVNKSTGMLKRWPIAEVSGTVKPMDHHQLQDGEIEAYKRAIENIAKNHEDINKFLASTSEEETGGEEPHQNHDAVMKNYYISKQNLAKLRLALMEKN